MKSLQLLAAIGAICIPMLSAAPAHAQATRTWVSGVGDDVNPCSRTAPCKTFAGAISKTAAGGEIDCLDPGGFGTVTITKSITIDCSTTLGSILASGTNGVNINDSGSGSPNTIRVILRGLSINGAPPGGGAGFIGVNYASGAQVHLDNVRIFGFQAGNARGVSMTSSGAGGNKLVISESIIEDNGTGIFIDPAGGSAQVSLTRVQIYRNTGQGFSAQGVTSGGIFAGIYDSVSSLNGANGFLAVGNGAISVLSVQRSAADNNGLSGFSANGAGAQIFIGSSMATANGGSGFEQVDGGQIRSYNNNAVDNNTSNGSVTAPTLPPL
jgi:hypothetical protein